MIDWSFIRGCGYGLISLAAVFTVEGIFVEPIHIAAAGILVGLVCLVFGYLNLYRTMQEEDVKQ